MDMLSSHWLDFNTGRKCVWVFLVGLVFVCLVVFLFPLPVNWKECLSFTYLFFNPCSFSEFLYVLFNYLNIISEI